MFFRLIIDIVCKCLWEKNLKNMFLIYFINLFFELILNKLFFVLIMVYIIWVFWWIFLFFVIIDNIMVLIGVLLIMLVLYFLFRKYGELLFVFDIIIFIVIFDFRFLLFWICMMNEYVFIVFWFSFFVVVMFFVLGLILNIGWFME